MATRVVGTGQLLELLAKAGGSPAALIYKAGTDLYDYYKSSDTSSPAKNTLQTAEEIHWKRPMLFYSETNNVSVASYKISSEVV
jgi:hypothetical protein